MKIFKLPCFLFFFLIWNGITSAQNAQVEGYIFEENNRGYLNFVKVAFIAKISGKTYKKVATNSEGFFKADLPLGFDWILKASKDVFGVQEVEFSTKDINPGKKLYLKVEMKRNPGYLFDVTLAEKVIGDANSVPAITGAKVEIYNNTTEKLEMNIDSLPFHNFSHTFKKGAHYTVLIRKEGYITKRLEAYIDVDGCILCFDGLDEVATNQPGASDILSSNNTMGTILANVELEKVVVGKKLKNLNLYYEDNKWNITDVSAKALDDLIIFLKANPFLMLEIGAHTDSRGSDDFNMELSRKRAKSVVDYLVQAGGISKYMLESKGYGETQLVNRCVNGLRCSDIEHAENRRTEIKVKGIKDYSHENQKSLIQIIREERALQLVAEEGFGKDQIEVTSFEDLPEDVKESIRKQDNAGSKKKIESNEWKIVENEDGNIPSSTTTTYVPKKIKKPSKISEGMGSLDNSSVIANGTKKPSIIKKVDEHRERQNENEPSNYKINSKKGTMTVQGLPVINFKSGNESNFSGFMIQIYQSPIGLRENHYIFKENGNIKVDHSSGRQYYYLIGEFVHRNIAQAFLDDKLKATYPNAKVMRTVKGIVVR